MSNVRLLITGNPSGGQQTPSQGLIINAVDSKQGTSATTHSLTGVPAGALLVLSTGMVLGGGIIPVINSTPSLTWTKRVDSDGSSGSAEIWTATFTAGGSISVTSNWGNGRQQSSTLYSVSNQDTVNGASAVGVQQIQPSVNITTTKAKSILFVITSDWNAEEGPAIYRGTPTIASTVYVENGGAQYHYYYAAPVISTYNVGQTFPNEFDGKGTAVLEVRTLNTGGEGGSDTTPPSAPVTTMTGTTSSSMSISWTASTDNVGVSNYEIYLNNILVTTKLTPRTHTFTGLTGDTTYNAHVRAKDAAGNGTNSNTVSGFTGTGGSGSLSPFTMTEIPYSDPDIITYGRGAEQWHYPCTSASGCPNGSGNWDRISNPTTSNPQWVENSKNVYHRMEWWRVEGNTQGDYRLGPTSFFGSRLAAAINNGQMFSFGIMPLNSDSSAGQSVQGGGKTSLPLYLHNAMMASPNPADRAQNIGGNWVANWNHPTYLARLRALHVAINNHLMTGTHTFPTGHARAGQTINLRDAIYCIDIRGFGDYGEWHMSGFHNLGTYTNGVFTQGNAPGNIEPTVATLKEIINCHTQVFQNWPLVMMVAAYNGYDNALPSNQNGSSIPIFHHSAEVAHYAMDATNAWGKVGYRRDQVVATDNYLRDLLSDNGTKFPTGVGDSIATKFLNLYKLAPGTGEPLPNAFDNHDTGQIDANIQLYKHTSFGNGNWPGNSISASDNTSSRANNIRAAFKRCGFRLKITTGEAPIAIVKGTPFQIKANWVNVGVAPCYDNWQVRYELQNNSGTVIWTGVSTKVLKLFRPDEGTVLTTDSFVVGPSTPSGTYKLVVKVIDPSGYRSNLLLAMKPINADSSYTIFNSVTVN